jgi:hypothetical protein
MRLIIDTFIVNDGLLSSMRLLVQHYLSFYLWQVDERALNKNFLRGSYG